MLVFNIRLTATQAGEHRGIADEPPEGKALTFPDEGRTAKDFFYLSSFNPREQYTIGI